MEFYFFRVFLYFISVFFAALLTSANAADDGIVLREPAVLYDSHSAQSTPLLILGAGHPLREVSRVDGWRKVFLFGGETGWVRESRLRALNAGVAIIGAGELAAVRVSPSLDAPEVFYVRRGVILEILQNAGAWLEVLHSDGETGFINAADMWTNF